MALVTTKELLLDAQKNGYAVGAFNVENMEMVQAVIAAAEELRSPVIMQTTPSTLKYADPDYFYANVATAAKKASVPVVMHLDHGSSFDLAMKAFRAGYTSIMIDGSHSVLEENIAITTTKLSADTSYLTGHFYLQNFTNTGSGGTNALGGHGFIPCTIETDPTKTLTEIRIQDGTTTSVANSFYVVSAWGETRDLDEYIAELNELIEKATTVEELEAIDVEAVEELFGKGYFDYILGQKPEYERKPSAEGVQIILEELGVEADDCLYIGDTSTDMQTGKNASMFTVGVTWGFRDETELITHGADTIIHTPMELLDILK